MSLKTRLSLKMNAFIGLDSQNVLIKKAHYKTTCVVFHFCCFLKKHVQLNDKITYTNSLKVTLF